MKKIIMFLAIVMSCFFIMPSCSLFAELLNSSEESSKQDEPVFAEPEASISETFAEYEVNWTTVLDDGVIGIPLSISTYCALPAEQINSSTNVVVYVINHNEEKVGTESDLTIVEDLLKEYIVIVVDYMDNEKAISPQLEQSVMNIKCDVIEGKYLNGLNYYESGVHVVPSGSRIKREIVYFDLLESAAKGTNERIMDIWNTTAKKKLGSKWVAADTIDEIPMKNGESLTAKNADGTSKYMNYSLDIIYPSQPAYETPVMMLGSSSNYPNRSTGYTDHPERVQYIGFLMNGYATVCYEHEYIPFMPSTAGWGYMGSHEGGEYTLFWYNGVKTHTAAVRCVKYYSEIFGYSNEKIGVYGHSKASTCSFLACPDPEKMPEDRVYPGYEAGETYGAQPYLTYSDGTAISSEITCLYHSMGYGSMRYEKIVSSENKPTLICCGINDDDGAWDYWADENEAYRQSGMEYLAIGMKNQGHTIPPYVKDTEYDYYYYDAFRAFFDYHLKGTNPTMLYTSVSSDGVQNKTEDLFIQFCAPVTKQSVEANVSVLDSSGKAVTGTWISEGKGNKWIFITDTFVSGARYTLKIGEGVKDASGKTIVAGSTVIFTVK